MRSNKWVIKIVLLTLVVILSLTLFACGNTSSGEGNVTILPDNSGATEVSYVVTFDSRGGSSVSSQTVKLNSLVQKPSTKKDGSTLIGWYLDNTLDEWDFNKDRVTQDITLYAVWLQDNPVLITSSVGTYSFSSNEGVVFTLSSSTDEVSLTNSISLKDSSYNYAIFLDKDNNQSVGQMNTLDFSDLEYGDNVFYITIYDSGLNVVEKSIKFNLYRTKVYNVYFYDLLSSLYETYQVDENTSIASAPELTRAGYGISWKKDSQTGATWSFGANGNKVDSNISLYAVSTPKKYTITLNTQGGNVSTKSVEVTFGSNFTIPIPTYKGYIFKGWYTSDNECITTTTGVSLGVWDIPSNITINATWDRYSYTLTHKLQVNGFDVDSNNSIYYTDEEILLSASENLITYYDAVEGIYTLYVFNGWKDVNGFIISSSREYVNTKGITADTTICEAWSTVNIVNCTDYSIDNSSFNPTKEVLDQIQFVGNVTFITNQNINLGESITLRTACACKKHTLDGWYIGDSKVSSGTSLTVNVSNTTFSNLNDMNIYMNWSEYNVNVVAYIDDVLVDDITTLGIDVEGMGPNTAGLTNIQISAISNDLYTFAGWYNQQDELLTDTINFTYVLNTMPNDDFDIYGKWYTTNTYLVIDYNSSLGSIVVVPESDNNIIGGNISFGINVNDGYMLSSIEDANSIDALHGYEIPDNTMTFTATIIDMPFDIDINILDAGAISYKINNSESYTVSTYGNNTILKGVTIGDDVSITASTYSGFVFLGFYDDESHLLSTSINYEYMVDTSNSKIIATYKPFGTGINLSAGVYIKANPSITIENTNIYTYDTVYNNVAVGTPVDANETYYSYGVTNVSQSITHDYKAKNPAFEYIITTVIPNGWRFEGWYNNDGEWLTFDKSYVVDFVHYSERYIARFTELDEEYLIQASMHTKCVNAGTLIKQSYKVGNSESEYKEYCDITVTTNKRPVADGYYGYKYFGIFDNTDGSLNSKTSYMEFQNLEVPQFATYFDDSHNELEMSSVSENHFVYTYVCDLSSYSSKVSYLVIYNFNDLEATTPYINPNSNTLSLGYIINPKTGENISTANQSTTNPGNIYYILDRNNTIYIEADPTSGYEFQYWKATVGSTVYATYNTPIVMISGNSYTYTAYWSVINDDDTSDFIVVDKNIQEAGEVQYKGYVGYQGSSTDERITFSQTTNPGYIFLGWYNDGKLISTNSSFDAIYEIPTDKIYYKIGVKQYELSKNFVAYYQKIDVKFTIESVGETNIYGYIEKDNNEERVVYVLTTKEAVLFSDSKTYSYGNYLFAGWYYFDDANGRYEFIDYDYTIIVPESELKDKYVALWRTNSKLAKVFTSEVGGDAYYAWSYDEVNNKYDLVLYAIPDNGYRFVGWRKVNEEGDPLLDEIGNQILDIYSSNYIERIEGRADINEYYYLAVFSSSLRNTPIINSSVGDGSGTTEFYASGSDETTRYTIVAKPDNGVIFAGWNYYDESEGIQKFYNYNPQITTTLTYDIILTPQFLKIKTYYDGFSMNIQSGFSSYVSYYAYYSDASGNPAVLNISINTPNGYVARVSYVKNDETIYLMPINSLCSEFVSSDIVYSYQITFEKVIQIIDKHLYINQSINNSFYRFTGTSVSEKDLFDDNYYYESAFIESAYIENGYTQMGWYNSEDNTALSSNAIYNPGVLYEDLPIVSRYGKYRIGFDYDEELGYVELENYEVRVQFDSNNKQISVASISDQVLSFGDFLTYPETYIGLKIKGFDNKYYVFSGWYSDKECSIPFEFDSKIIIDTTIYAGWIIVADNDKVIFEKDENSPEIIYSMLSSEKLNAYKYVAISDGTAVLYVRNSTSNMKTEVTINGRTTVITDITFNTAIIFDTEIGEEYLITIAAITNTNEYTIFLKVENNLEKTTLSVNDLIAADVEITMTVSTSEYDNTNNVNKYSVNKFIGWFINDTLIDTKQTLVISPYDFDLYVNSDGIIIVEPRWTVYTLTIINKNKYAGSFSIALDNANNSLIINISPDKTNNRDYNFLGFFIYDIDNRTTANDPLDNSPDSFRFSYPIGNKDVYLVADWENNTNSDKAYRISYEIGDGYNSPYNPLVIYSSSISATANDSANIIELYNPVRLYENGDQKGFYIFDGWYTEPSYTNRIESLDISTLVSDIRIYAKWGDPICNIEILNDGKYDYVELGRYPQSLVTDSITFLGTNSSGYLYDELGNEYAKLTISEKLVYDGEIYEPGIYYFKVEPVKWYIVSDVDGLLKIQSANILFSYMFNSTTNNRTINGSTVYSNNWENSSLRAHLQTNIFTKMFTELEQNFIKYASRNQLIINDTSTGSSNLIDKSVYPWIVQNSTKDNIFIYSYLDANQFAEYKPSVTMYAVFNGATLVTNNGETYLEYSNSYWLRSPGNTARIGYYVSSNGDLKTGAVTNTLGVLPVVYIMKDLGE